MTTTARPATAAVLLAAGAGTRLGLGPKALLQDDAGTPWVRRLATVLLEAGCAPVCVVLGAGSDSVRAAVDLSDCTVITHPQWAEGMGGSYRRGVQAVPAGRPVLVALVDQPGVDAALVRRLLGVHATGGRITAAAYRGSDGKLRRGHPVVFSPDVAAAAAEQAHGDRGARDFLAGHPELVDLVDCSDLSDGGDVDTPADLLRLRRA